MCPIVYHCLQIALMYTVIPHIQSAPVDNVHPLFRYRRATDLYHMYKLYEHLILNRIAPSVDRHLIKEHTGFRPGKSCCSQLLNLTQHIRDGCQRGMLTGAAFVDLSAAYDTVNHRLLIRKLYDFTEDSPLCRVIQNML